MALQVRATTAKVEWRTFDERQPQPLELIHIESETTRRCISHTGDILEKSVAEAVDGEQACSKVVLDGDVRRYDAFKPQSQNLVFVRLGYPQSLHLNTNKGLVTLYMLGSNLRTVSINWRRR